MTDMDHNISLPNATAVPDFASTGDVPQNIDVLSLMESGPVYMTKLEQILFSTYLSIIVAFTYLTNALFIWVVGSDPDFHRPNKIALVAHAIYDLCLVTFWFVPGVTSLIAGKLYFTGKNVSCLLMRVLNVTPYLCETHSMIVICLERVFYFYRPMIYERIVTVKRIIIIECVLFTSSFTYILITSALGTPFASPTSLMCSLTGLKIYATLNLSLFYVPSMFVCAFAIIALLAIIVKHKKSIAALPHEDGQIHQNQLLSNIKTGLRLVACISGSYWLTYFPVLVTVYMVREMATFLQMELGEAPTARMLRRCSLLGYGLGFMCNSIVYILIDKRLKNKVTTLIKRKKSEDS